MFRTKSPFHQLQLTRSYQNGHGLQNLNHLPHRHHQTSPHSQARSIDHSLRRHQSHPVLHHQTTRPSTGSTHHIQASASLASRMQTFLLHLSRISASVHQEQTSRQHPAYSAHSSRCRARRLTLHARAVFVGTKNHWVDVTVFCVQWSHV